MPLISWFPYVMKKEREMSRKSNEILKKTRLLTDLVVIHIMRTTFRMSKSEKRSTHEKLTL